MGALEQLWGGVTLETAPGVFPLTTDTMLLADFVRLRRRAAVADLGCGGGALGLLLCGRQPDCTVRGVDVLPAACDLARRNAARNGLTDRFSVTEGDLRDIRALLPAGCCTDAVSNPPYFPADAPASPEADRAAARSRQACSAETLCRAAAWVLRWGGRFSVVYRPEGLCDLLWALRASRLEPKRLRPVRCRPGGAVSLLLVEARLGGRPGLLWEPDLLLEDADGNPSADVRRIYHLEGGA